MTNDDLRTGATREEGIPGAPDRTERSPGWRLHDIVAGLLAGTGAGLVAAIFIVARMLDQGAVVVVCVAIGAGLGVLLVERAGRDRNGVTPVRVTAWVVVVLTVSFVGLLIQAIRNLE